MYAPLYAGYGAATLVIWGATFVCPSLWPRVAVAGDASLPLWRSLLIMGAVLALGQLYQAGLMLPEDTRWRDAARLTNQVLIFLPVLVAVGLALRAGDTTGRARAFTPRSGVPQRLMVGCAGAVVAIVVHLAVRPDAADLSVIPARLFSFPNAAHAAQILGEDLALGLLLASVLRHVSPRAAVVTTGSVFAAGHIPAMLERGAPLSEFPSLVADAGLATGVLALVLRLRDLWPIWPVHVAMDLMQFYGGR